MKIEGVESVKADWESGKLTVIGNVDPTKVKEVVEKKTKKKVELVSPQLNKASKEGNGGNKKPDEKKSEKKSADKKAEAETADKPKEVLLSSSSSSVGLILCLLLVSMIAVL